MNKIITSRSSILEKCRELVEKKGLPAVNMREVAKVCGVAIGTIYYYFPSKEDLLLETVESVWTYIFSEDGMAEEEILFTTYIDRWFAKVRIKSLEYPNFLTMHSIALADVNADRAKIMMYRHLDTLNKRMLDVLEKDNKISGDVFDGELKKDALAKFVISNLMSLLIQQREDCKVLIILLNNVLYAK